MMTRIIGQIWGFNKRKIMKKFLMISFIMLFSGSAFAGSCPMMANKIEAKIAEAQELKDAGMKAHKNGNHAKSEELLNKALDLFKG